MEQILILEDDENFREIVADLLEAEGYQVTAVGSAQEAIEVALQHDFHLLLTDVRMAGGADGVSALEAIKSRAEHLRSIVMTGFADREVPIRAARLQADDYLTKPFELHELSRCLRTVLDREPAPAPGLLDKLLSSPGSLWESSRRWLHDKELRSLERVRSSFYQRLYLLIRSGRISAEEAHPVFNRLVPIERELLRNDPSLWTSLTQAFQELDVALLDSLSGQALASAEWIPRVAFRRLYQRVHQGFLEAEHFLRALPLWLSPEARKTDLDAYTCYCRIWEEDVSQQGEDPFVGLSLSGVCLTRRLMGVTQARLYETKAQQGRVLCLPVQPENQAFLEAELASQRVQHLGDFQQHHLLLYPKPAGTLLKRRLRPGGLPPSQAWVLLQPLFQEVERLNLRQLYCGCFGQGHVSFQEDGSVCVEGFGPNRWHALAASVTGQTQELFLAAPELIHEATPGPRSDQFVLARIFGEAVFGVLKPVDSFTLFASDIASPAKTRLADRMGRLWPVLEKMTAINPQQRFPSIGQAGRTLEACLQN